MKNLTALFLALLIALSAVCVSAFSSGGYKNGDVNRDGNTKIQDANLIQRYLANFFEFDSEQKALADYDLNGKVNIVDVTEIQLVLVEAKSAPEEPTTRPESETTQPVSETAQPTTETQPATQEATAPSPKVNSTVKVYFSNNKWWSKVCFYVYDSASGTPQKAWPGTEIKSYITNSGGERVYYADVDTSRYDRIIFTDGTNQTVNVPVNKASSGFYISDDGNTKAMRVGTYAYTGSDSGKIIKTNLNYPSGGTKKIWIWTPADYNAAGDKFRTLYVLDGQNLFDDDHSDGYGGWEVTDAVESMMSNGGRGTIIVGIDNGSSARDSELTPNIGDVVPSYAKDFSNGTGETFSNFFVNTVMPYVQANYNSSKAAVDNMIAGSSSGGIESFYIGMEHKDKFGMIGALSPAFLLYSDSVWNSYLSKYDLASSDMPRIYMYSGRLDDLEKNIYSSTVSMLNRLTNSGYNTDKLKLSIEDNAEHNEAFWRIIFPECISWLLDI